MTSYMYSPSKKVTELLSKFLEFDATQLEFGIWNGDLSLKNVNLRQESIDPLLNKRASQPHTDARTKAPLRMKLVSGSIGSMRIRIPWKRMVWGQGSVQLDISDVMIVLAFTSREETDAFLKQAKEISEAKHGAANDANSQDGSDADGANGSGKPSRSKKNKRKKAEAAPPEDDIKQTPAYRNAKQRRLREAERRHLQGLPVAVWLDSVHRKNSIEREALRAQEEQRLQHGNNVNSSNGTTGTGNNNNNNNGSSHNKSTGSGGNNHANNNSTRSRTSAIVGNTNSNADPSTEPGRFERWLTNATSDFFWRFYAGLQGSIKKARIVVVQDGIEVGCIVHSIEVIAGKEEAKVSVVMEHDVGSKRKGNTKSHANGSHAGGGPSTIRENDSEHESANSDTETLPSNVVYEGAYDDGEHVDKRIKQHGLGLFVRREGNMSKVPPTLRFSTSVSADDYVLRPVHLNLSFSMFYPYPPERRKKRQNDAQSHATNPTEASTAVSPIESPKPEKKRRGKRDKVSQGDADTVADSSMVLPISSNESIASRSQAPSIPQPTPFMASQSSSRSLTGGREHSQRLRRTHRRIGMLNDSSARATNATAGMNHSSRRTSTRSISLGSRKLNFDEMSTGITEAPTVVAEHPTDPVPRLECHVDLEDIRVMFSNRHYDLLARFLSTVERMKNGRPSQTIRSVKKLDATTSNLHATFLLDHHRHQDLYNLNHTQLEGLQTADARSHHSNSEHKEKKGLKQKLLNSKPIKMLLSTDRNAADTKDAAKQASSPFEFNIPPALLKARKTRFEVIRKWWHYSIGAVTWEIRKSKSLRSNFHKMYICFDWSKQKYKRKEYVDLYIATRLDASSNLEETDKSQKAEKEEQLMKLEDELPLEQVLLYRTIARALRVRGKSTMPSSITELHAADKLGGASRANFLYSAVERMRSRATTRGNDALNGAGTSAFLSIIQERFEFAKNLRGNYQKAKPSLKANAEPDVVFEDSPTRRESSPRHDGNEPKSPDNGHVDLEDGLSSMGGMSRRRLKRGSMRSQHFQGSTRSLLGRNTSVGHDSMVSDAYQTYTSARVQRRPSGDAFDASTQVDSITAGSRVKDSASQPNAPDTRPMRSMHSRSTLRHLRTGGASVAGTRTAPPPADTSMKFAFSFKIKSVALIIIEEDHYVDFMTENKGRSKSPIHDGMHTGTLSRSNEFGEDSSSDDMSELSGLTDDQRFFNDHGPVTIPEEEIEDVGGARLSSTDFLRFNQPENILLQLTIEPLAGSFRTRSRGPKKMTLSVGRISAVGDNDVELISMGYDEPPKPMAEVKLDGTYHRATSNDLGGDSSMHGVARSIDRSLDMSRHTLGTDDEFNISGVSRRKSTRAIFVRGMTFEEQKTLLCDLSKVTARVDMDPITKLLKFYNRSTIIFPDKITSKSSREVARKYLVHKASGSEIERINATIKLSGVELRVPLPPTGMASEASSLASSYHSDPFSEGNRSRRNGDRPAAPISHAIFSVTALELYSGRVVEEMKLSDSGVNESGTAGIWQASTRIRAIGGRQSLDMLDVQDVMSTHDPFTCHHWVGVVTGINCTLDSLSDDPPQLLEAPINIESLITVNHVALLETENPKKQASVEVSPIHVILSRRRLELLSQAANACKLENGPAAKTASGRKRVKPDPPRIEILSRQLLHSIDLNCKQFKLTLVRDLDVTETLTAKVKEVIMEECISDFLSVLACFDFSLPNEEALSSAMQICIGRLVGIGFSDEEAWACTNGARVNFLNDIALMKKAQTDVLVQMHASIRTPSFAKQPLIEEDSDSSEDSIDFVAETAGSTKLGKSSDHPEHEATDASSHDDSENTVNSIDIVETTLQNAVERTIVTFGPLLEDENIYVKRYNTFLCLDLAQGIQLSRVQLFYDSHTTATIPAFAVTNAAGVEIATLVPAEVQQSVESGDEQHAGAQSLHGAVFSRFDFDQGYQIGQGGLPITVLASDDGSDNDVIFRPRSRLDDINIGELEILFASNLYEEIIDEIKQLEWNPKDHDSTASNVHHDHDPNFDGSSFSTEESGILTMAERPPINSSCVLFASSISALLTSDTLVPFSRMTLDEISYRSPGQLSKPIHAHDGLPTWTLVSRSAMLQNLTPEGQAYPTALEVLPTETMRTEEPFEVAFYKSPDPWKQSSRLDVTFREYRLILFRQYLYEVLHFFTSDKYGVGRLKNKYSTDVRDRNGNSKPPLMYSVYIHDTSVVCPKMSTSCDMVTFEVEKATFAVSYHPESFAMPTPQADFDLHPFQPESNHTRRSHQPSLGRQNSDASSVFFDCHDGTSVGGLGTYEDDPISSFDSSWKRRFGFKFERFRAYTAMAPSRESKRILETPLFRFLYALDGRASRNKRVYVKQDVAEPQTLSGQEFMDDAAMYNPRWEEVSMNPLNLEMLIDSADYTRVLLSDREGLTPFALDAKLSQLCLLMNFWFSNMQELPTMFPFTTDQVEESAKPPDIPDDFPKYGTKEFVDMLGDLSSAKSEICCLFRKLSLRCTFDEPGHFDIDPDCFKYFTDGTPQENGLVLTLCDASVHVINDQWNVKRIGVASNSLELIDERRKSDFEKTLMVLKPEANASNWAWADYMFGLQQDIRQLHRPLPAPFILSVFMAPEWSSINVGATHANGIMFDMSWIWIFLDYFKSYFTMAEFGNPGHEAQKWAHKIKNSLLVSLGKKREPFEPLPGVNVDFRLWLYQPILCLPSNLHDTAAPCVKIDCKSGLWYRMKSIQDLSSQEVATTDINLRFLSEFRDPCACRKQDSYDVMSWSRPLIEGLSFGLRLESNNLHHHRDVSVQIPFHGDHVTKCSFVDKEIDVLPKILPVCKVLRPAEPHIARHLGTQVCDITCIIEVLPLTIKTMSGFFSAPELEMPNPPPENEPQTTSVAANIADMRIFAIDPELGVQLPVAVVSIGSTSLTMSRLELEDSNDHVKVVRTEANPQDFQVVVESTVWADYFKLGITRSWEPLLEPVKCLVLYEKSLMRGEGFIIDADTPVHLNLSGALLQILSDTFESFDKQIRETFQSEDKTGNERSKSMASLSPGKNHVSALVEDGVGQQDGNERIILHEIPKPLKRGDRVAFSMRNLTGQKIRVHQLPEASDESARTQPAIVTYLNDKESMGLTFAATVSRITNLSVTEVPYPGFLNSQSNGESSRSMQHSVSIQLPGFTWLPGIKVDTFGRKFQPIAPKSDVVRAKIAKDWRLKNAMKVLTEVGLDGGGRLVTVRSLFEIRNNTMHEIKIILHPDPLHEPYIASIETDLDPLFVNRSEDKDQDEDADEVIKLEPGGVFQMPTLLVESALHLVGNHLGCFWIRPTTEGRKSAFRKTRDFADVGEITRVDFCSRPIQLAKIVHESSVMFQANNGQDIPVEKAKSGIQVSCPTAYESVNTKSPFCYAVEVARSPIVKSSREVDDAHVAGSKPTAVATDNKTPAQNEKKPADNQKSRKRMHLHGPVAYTISVHSPLVIANLLPQAGRFELMHAVRRTVLWYADLVPGQQIPIHSVGLDAPLLLLVNLGYCRTPVGEGALVHHGTDLPSTSRDASSGLKTIGKAVLKGRKQIGKKLNAITESPDKRARNRLDAARKVSKKADTNNKRTTIDVSTKSGSLGLDNTLGVGSGVAGKVHSIEGTAYSENDLATETTVVDGMGQRLRLNVENTRGGGGQRRISLFCPFWIINTTEHALRYKKEKSKSFVSGTVVSQAKDGSQPVDGSNRNYRKEHTDLQQRQLSNAEQWTNAATPLNTKTIFAGTPGALATASGRCNLPSDSLCELLNGDMPLEKLSELAFMFNFHEENSSSGHQMMSTQLHDGTEQTSYTTDWSRGFSLDSVGVSQTVSMHCREGRYLQLSVVVSVAPGFLSGYTKIVRFLPKYVLYNTLDRPVRIWQDSSVHRQGGEEQYTGDYSDIHRMSNGRKWRLASEDVPSEKLRINQYESLHGRQVVLEELEDAPVPQGTTAHDSALYITTIPSSELAAFHMPDSRADKELRLDFGGPFNVTSSFNTDAQSEHTLAVTGSVDPRTLHFVSTRAAPKYKIALPPPNLATSEHWDGELGVFFETDWGGDRRIVVKSTKRGKYAFNNTDIHVGDELLRIDGASVARMTFSEAMRTLKDRIAYVRSVHNESSQEQQTALRRGMRRLSLNARLPFGPGSTKSQSERPNQSNQLTLTFRTLEERLRKVRMKANREAADNQNRNMTQRIGTQASVRSLSSSSVRHEAVGDVHVETKTLHNINFIILRPQDPANPPFRIQNRSLKQTVFYRQRGCEGHKWNFLSPGESASYAWEEPMKSKKLAVRVASSAFDVFKAEFASSQGSVSEIGLIANEENLGLAEERRLEKRRARVARMRQALAYQFVNTEERGGFGPSVTVRLEEIGHRNFLPLPSTDTSIGSRTARFLTCEVDTDGGTRQLVISDGDEISDERATLQSHLDTLKMQAAYEQQRVANLNSVKNSLTVNSGQNNARYGYGPTETEHDESEANERATAAEEEARNLMEDFSEGTIIMKKHQIIVEVMEVVGLNSSDIVGTPNLYGEVSFKARSKARRYFFQKRSNKMKTYFVENSLKPKWNDQMFIFDVPKEAVKITRGYSVHVKVRNFRSVGQHPVLGQAVIHLGNVRNQKELVGWYPLGGRTGRRDVEASPLSDFGRGSVKLRVHWVYTSSALIDYFKLICETRLTHLISSQVGMRNQLASAIESDKRKREADDQVARGRRGKPKRFGRSKNRNLAKHSSRQHAGNQSRTKLELESKARRVVGKLNHGLNSGVSALRSSLRASRDRYLYALYFQTVESRRNRQEVQEAQNDDTSAQDSTNQALRTSLHRTSSTTQVTKNQSASSSKMSLDSFLSDQRTSMRKLEPENIHTSRRSLDDFFTDQKQTQKSREQTLLDALQTDSLSQNSGPRHRRSVAVFDAEGNRRTISHRRLSLDKDDMLMDDESVKEWHPALRQGQAMYDAMGPARDIGISDLMSVSTDVEEEQKKKKLVRRLVETGFAFHQCGEAFHENHMPYHFRQSLSQTIDLNKRVPAQKVKWFVGTSSEVRLFKSWQSAQAIYNHPDITVIQSNGNFTLRLKPPSKRPSSSIETSSNVWSLVRHKLMVPSISPSVLLKRSEAKIEAMYQSRKSFEHSCRRSLKTMLNPGGWLTIRPITVLNLPDSFNGMFVKVRYGSSILQSETVDAKVTPRWLSQEAQAFMEDWKPTGRMAANPNYGKHNRSRDGKFEFCPNDLHIQVEPHQTSGVIKLAIVGEKSQNKTELGILNIPLGAAIEACVDAAETYLDQSSTEQQEPNPIFVRWFPLMNPRDSAPAEGDLGFSGRPTEEEQSRDNAFQQYFAPCIQLALMWWPDVDAREGDDDEDYGDDIGLASAPPSSRRLSDGNAFYTNTSGDDIGPRRVPHASTGGPSGVLNFSRTPKVQKYYKVDVNRVSAALIDSQKASELLAFVANDIDLRYSISKSRTRAGLVVGWIQLDHQNSRSREPVVLAPTPVEHVQPTLQFLAVINNLRSKANIMSYEYIGVAVQELDFTVEESWIFELWEFFMAIWRRRQAKLRNLKGQRRADVLRRNENFFSMVDEIEAEEETVSLLSTLQADGAMAPSQLRKVYIEQLVLGLVKVNLSYVKGKKQSFELSDEGARALKNVEVKELHAIALGAGKKQLATISKAEKSEVFARWSQHTSDEEMLQEDSENMSYNLPGIIAAVFPSVSDAPIRLQGKTMHHLFESPTEIFSNIKNYYVNETLKQVYKIVGSLDFVGNPTILFSSFVTGVRDFVVAPATAFLKSPTDVNQVGIGVAKGAISLFSHSTSGIFGFAAKMSATAGHAAAILSLDSEFRQWHRDRVVTEVTNMNREWKRRGVQDISEIVTRPVGDVVLGVAMGASGLILSPYKGFIKKGKWGLVKGVAIGTVGVVAKPIVGFLDAFTHFSATVHDIARSVNILERRYQPALKVRLPYIFGPMKILAPFDAVAARSVSLLGLFKPKSKRRQRYGDPETSKEIHVLSEVLMMEPGVETYAIVTTWRIVLIKLKKDNSGVLHPSFCWEVPLNANYSVTSQITDHGHNGVALTITKTKRKRRRANRDPDENEHDAKIDSSKNSVSIDMNMNATMNSSMNINTNNSVLMDNASQPGLPHQMVDDDDFMDERDGKAMLTDELYAIVEADGADVASVTKPAPKGGESTAASAWYTVLAEYQHRQQLTRVHNAVCCITGALENVIMERERGECAGEGVSSFGMFTFEKRIAKATEQAYDYDELSKTLDTLPWLGESMFRNLQHVPRSQQKEVMYNSREKWTFPMEVESSEQQGGPQWLVMSRARATFVPFEQQCLHINRKSTDPDESTGSSVSIDYNDGEMLHVFDDDGNEEEEGRGIKSILHHSTPGGVDSSANAMANGAMEADRSNSGRSNMVKGNFGSNIGDPGNTGNISSPFQSMTTPSPSQTHTSEQPASNTSMKLGSERTAASNEIARVRSGGAMSHTSSDNVRVDPSTSANRPAASSQPRTPGSSEDFMPAQQDSRSTPQDGIPRDSTSTIYSEAKSSLEAGAVGSAAHPQEEPAQERTTAGNTPASQATTDVSNRPDSSIASTPSMQKPALKPSSAESSAAASSEWLSRRNDTSIGSRYRGRAPSHASDGWSESTEFSLALHGADSSVTDGMTLGTTPSHLSGTNVLRLQSSRSTSTAGASLDSTQMSATSFQQETRLNRLESLIEQLAIFNASSELQRSQSVVSGVAAASAAGGGGGIGTGSGMLRGGIGNVQMPPGASAGATTGAATSEPVGLRRELEDLKAQVQARGKEDDALREEITQLRAQLAGRRRQAQQRDADFHRNNNGRNNLLRKVQIPNMLRFTTTPRNDDNAGSRRVAGASAAVAGGGGGSGARGRNGNGGHGRVGETMFSKLTFPLGAKRMMESEDDSITSMPPSLGKSGDTPASKSAAKIQSSNSKQAASGVARRYSNDSMGTMSNGASTSASASTSRKSARQTSRVLERANQDLGAQYGASQNRTGNRGYY